MRTKVIRRRSESMENRWREGRKKERERSSLGATIVGGAHVEQRTSGRMKERRALKPFGRRKQTNKTVTNSKQ